MAEFGKLKNNNDFRLESISWNDRYYIFSFKLKFMSGKETPVFGETQYCYEPDKIYRLPGGDTTISKIVFYQYGNYSHILGQIELFDQNGNSLKKIGPTRGNQIGQITLSNKEYWVGAKAVKSAEMYLQPLVLKLN